MNQFYHKALPYLQLGQEYKKHTTTLLQEKIENTSQINTQLKLKQTIRNLRKQHCWGDLTDAEYLKEKRELSSQLNILRPLSTKIIDIKRAEELLSDLPDLWSNPGVTDNQRESFIHEIFQKVEISGSDLVAIEPKLDYQPIFAGIIAQGVRQSRGEWI